MITSSKPRTSKWKIGLGSLYAWFLYLSIVRCYSVFYQPLMIHFDSDLAGVSQINALLFIGSGIGSVILPIFLKYCGYRAIIMSAGFIGGISILVGSLVDNLVTLSVFIGFIPGVCCAFNYNTMIFLCCKYSDKTANILIQLLSFGGSLGPLLTCPVFQLLIDNLSWRGALQIIAGLFLQIMVVGATLLPDLPQSKKGKENKSSYKEDNSTNEIESVPGKRKQKRSCYQVLTQKISFLHPALLARIDFWAYAMAFTSYSSSYLMIPTYIIPFGTEGLRLDNLLASTVVSGLSVGDGISKFFHALFYARLSKKNRLLAVVISFLLMGICFCSIPFTTTYIAFMCLSIVFGIIGGGLTGDFMLMIADEFTIEIYPYVNGYACLISYTILFGGQILTGTASDQLGSSTAFFIGGGFTVVGAVFMLLLFLVSKNRQTHINQETPINF